MNVSNLEDILSDIEKKCKENDIYVFRGHLFGELENIIEWDENDHKMFIQIAKQAGIKILVAEYYENHVELTKEDKAKAKEVMSEDEYKQLIEAYAIATKNEGKIGEITLSFFYHGACYQFSIVADWYSDLSIIEDYIGIGSEEAHEDQNHFFKEMPKSQLKEYTKKILQDLRIQKYLNDAEAARVIRAIVRELNIEDDFHWQVIAEVKNAYYTEVKPKAEVDLKKKILQLKRENKKITMTEISSRLAVSLGVVRKYFYADK